jgi:hypothetical protein
MSRNGAPHLLIDAHNVLHHDAELRRLMGEPEQARGELERLLADRPRVVVFYDGDPGGVTHVLRRQGLTIDYSGAAEADDRIVAWLREHADRRAAVVSDDGGLRARARSLGAALIDARGFLDGFRRERDPRTERGPLSAGEVDDWLRIFGLDQRPPR